MERQTLRLLPATGTVVFSIKTDVAPLSSLSGAELAGLAAAFAALPPDDLAYKGGPALRERLQAMAASYQNP